MVGYCCYWLDVHLLSLPRSPTSYVVSRNCCACMSFSRATHFCGISVVDDGCTATKAMFGRIKIHHDSTFSCYAYSCVQEQRASVYLADECISLPRMRAKVLLSIVICIEQMTRAGPPGRNPPAC